MTGNEPLYPVELEAIDITPYRAGNTSVEYVTSLASGQAGPNVLISALVHGNEISGAIVLDELMRQELRPARGRLTLMFANTAAYHHFDPETPFASRFVEEDLNRVWHPAVLGGERDSVECRRARELRPIVEQADFLLDLHSMQHPAPALMMVGPLHKGRTLAQQLGTPEYVVCDSGHAAGTRMRDYGGFGDSADAKVALLIESGQHWATATLATTRDTVFRFLREMELISAAEAEPHLLAPPPSQTVVEVTDAVTVESTNFRFAKAYRGMERITDTGTEIARDGDRPVRTPYGDCLLIMPSRRLKPGDTAVRFGHIVA